MSKYDNAFIEDIYKLSRTRAYQSLKEEVMKDILEEVCKTSSDRDIAHMAGRKYVFELVESIIKPLKDRVLYED